MSPSKDCLDLVMRFESCRLNAYWATADEQRRGIATIGWGATGPDVRIGMSWTQLQADTRLFNDLKSFGIGVDHELSGTPTTQGQFDALVDFAYNCGMEAEETSTLLKLHRAGDYEGADAEFAKWNHQSGVVLAGLTRRRAAEAALYMKED